MSSMSKLFLLLLTVLLVIGGVIFFWSSDEKKIKANLASLAEYCSSTKREPVVETLKKLTQAAKLCTDPCFVKIDSINIDHEFSPSEMTDRFLMLKKRLPDTVFSFHDTFIEVATGNLAEVITTLRLKGENIDGQFTDAYELNIVVEKRDGDWLFSSFSVVEFMKK